jgi:hypothetical protein
MAGFFIVFIHGMGLPIAPCLHAIIKAWKNPIFNPPKI